MPDWTQSMQRTYEYYIVDPVSWKDKTKLDNVKSSSINRDLDTDTLGSATIDIVGTIEECYVRIYLITVQNGVRERFSLGTYLVQTPSYSFDGKIKTATIDAYTPLIELKENPPPLGYYIPKGGNIMNNAYRVVSENLRAPVSRVSCDETLYEDFVANTDDKWITFANDLIGNANYSLDLDELGRVLFTPYQETASLQPVWTFNDDNSSILQADLTLDHDMFGIPNVVEVIYSTGTKIYTHKIVNDDENSPTSTINRGREIKYVETNPKIGGVDGTANSSQVKEYAKRLLSELSTVEYSVSYSHAYCPVKPGDCIRLNYERAGIKNVKAKIMSQTIKCDASCMVSEKAVFTEKLWR